MLQTLTDYYINGVENALLYLWIIGLQRVKIRDQTEYSWCTNRASSWIRRAYKKIITAAAIKLPGLKRSAVVNKLSPAATACGCASNAALAASVLKKHSETPKYCGQKANLMKKQISHHSHSHSKSGQCSGVK